MVSLPLVCVLYSTYCVRQTVPIKTIAVNNFLMKITVHSVVLMQKASSSRSRVPWFESLPRQFFTFFLFASFISYQLQNLTKI